MTPRLCGAAEWEDRGYHALKASAEKAQRQLQAGEVLCALQWSAHLALLGEITYCVCRTLWTWPSGKTGAIMR